MDTIFFVLSKVVQFCIEPLNWVIGFIFFALLFMWLRKPEISKKFLLFALLDLLIIGWLPTSESLLRVLEERVPPTSINLLSAKELGGIIILGGAVRSGTTGPDRGEVSLGSAAERVTKSFELMRRYPDLPFIFTGFSDQIIPQGVSEAEAFKQLVAEQGLGDRVGFYENQSRNTYENALLTKPIIRSIDQGSIEKPWLLVTSARHMYRSLLLFQKQGIKVIPISVDYQTGNSLSWSTFDLEQGTFYWNKLIHEYVGLIVYWITGKI